MGAVESTQNNKDNMKEHLDIIKMENIMYLKKIAEQKRQIESLENTYESLKNNYEILQESFKKEMILSSELEKKVKCDQIFWNRLVTDDIVLDYVKTDKLQNNTSEEFMKDILYKFLKYIMKLKDV